MDHEQLFLEAIVTNDDRTARFILEKRGEFVEKYFKKRFTGGTLSGSPIHIAASCKSIDVLTLLIQEFNAKVCKVNRSDDESNILHYWAASYVPTAGAHVQPSSASSSHLLRLLLPCGLVDLNLIDRTGRSPLFTAVEEGNLDLVKLLLSEGADASIVDENNETPLHCLPVIGPNAELGQLLLDHGCNCRVKSISRRVALHKAAEYDSMAGAALLLIAAGAKINVQDAWGTTPLHFAARWGNYVVIKALIAHNADILEPINALEAPLELSRYLGRAYTEEDCSVESDVNLPPLATTPLQLARFFDVSDDPELDEEEQAVPRRCEEVMVAAWMRFHTWRQRYNMRVFCALLALRRFPIRSSGVGDLDSVVGTEALRALHLSENKETPNVMVGSCVADDSKEEKMKGKVRRGLAGGEKKKMKECETIGVKKRGIKGDVGEGTRRSAGWEEGQKQPPRNRGCDNFSGHGTAAPTSAAAAVYGVFLQADLQTHIESFLGPRDPWEGIELRNREAERRWQQARRNEEARRMRIASRGRRGR